MLLFLQAPKWSESGTGTTLVNALTAAGITGYTVDSDTGLLVGVRPCE